MTHARQVIILGLDGATLDLVEPWAAAGHLPSLGRVLTSGATGRLRSTIQPLTAPAWTSFLTGQNPGRHGIFDFIARRPGTYQIKLASARDRLSPSLWALLSRHGRRVAAVNVPMMYPPETINGILIAGVDAPGGGSHFVSPAEFYPEFRRAVPSYIIATSPTDLDGWVAGCRAMMDAHTRAFEYLWKREHWDVLMVVFSATDMAQHVFWKAMATGHPIYGDVIRDVYRLADAMVGRVLDDLGDDGLLLVMSDHGAGPLRRVVRINRYLQEGNFLSAPPTAHRREVPRESLARFLKAGLVAGKRYLPPETRSWLKRRWGGVRDQIESVLVQGRFDWERTRIYSVGSYGNLYVNLQGREPQGQVAPGADYEQLVRDVTDYLLDLRDPADGQPVIERVWRREEIYHGPALWLAPDLILGWRGYEYDCRQRFGDDGLEVFEETIRLNDLAHTDMTSCHRLDGLLMAYGACVRPGPIAGAAITDVAPTILHALGLPVAGDMDGHVLEDLFAAPEPVVYETPSPPLLSPKALGEGAQGVRAEPSAAETGEVEARLRGLGYLE